MPQVARWDEPQGSPPCPEADVSSTVEAIRFKVRQALYTSSSTVTFLTFFKRLVDEGALSDEQFEQHHAEISRLYHEWRTGSQVQHRQHNQHMLPSPKSLPLPEALPHIITSPQPEHGWTDGAAARLRAAVVSIVTNWELLDARTAWLYLPSNMNHVTVPVTMVKSSYSQSYIRAETLEQNQIKWNGNTIILRWKNMAIRGDEDQRVQQTCFNVVGEEMASHAGLRSDMLIGSEHNLPLRQHIGAPAAEETSSANSSVTVRIDDAAAQSSEDWPNDAERHTPPRPAHDSQSQIVMLMFSGTDANLNCAQVYRSLRYGPFVGPPEAGRSHGRSVDSQSPASAECELSYSINAGRH